MKAQRQRENRMRKGTEKTQRRSVYKKTAEAAEAEEWAVESMQRCLQERQETILEALKYEARPTTIKAAAEGEIVEATVNGYFVSTKEAGRGQSDDAEAAWVEREEEGARVKAMLVKVTREIEDSQRYICDLGQEMDTGWIDLEKERRRVEEWNAGVRKERHKEKQELKWKIVAGEVVRNIQGEECVWGVWRMCLEMVRVRQRTREEETLEAALQGNAVEDGRDTSGDEGNAVEDGRDTSGDEATHMAGDFSDFESKIAAVMAGDFSDFESTIAAARHSRTTERRRGALADKAQRRNKDGRKTLCTTHEHKEDGDEGWKCFWERTDVKDQLASSQSRAVEMQGVRVCVGCASSEAHKEKEDRQRKQGGARKDDNRQ